MTTMVEKVARAMCTASFLGGDKCAHPNCNKTCREIATAQARAAIEAMYSPTPKMLDAGAESGAEWRFPGKYVAGEVWQAMIDAALEETE